MHKKRRLRAGRKLKVEDHSEVDASKEWEDLRDNFIPFPFCDPHYRQTMVNTDVFVAIDDRMVRVAPIPSSATECQKYPFEW